MAVPSSGFQSYGTWIRLYQVYSVVQRIPRYSKILQDHSKARGEGGGGGGRARKLDYSCRFCLSQMGSFLLFHITKTCLYNFDPLKPHFYTVKLGFTGVYIIFLFLLKNIVTKTARRFVRVPTIYVLSRNMKNIGIFIWKFSFFWW